MPVAAQDLLVHLRRAHEGIDRRYAEPLDPSRSPHRPSERPHGIEAVMRDDSGNWPVPVGPRPDDGSEFRTPDRPPRPGVGGRRLTASPRP